MLGGLYSSYYDPSQFYNPYYGQPTAAQQRAIEQREREEQQRLEQYSAQQSRRSQYLPSDDEEESDQGTHYYEYTPRERIYRDGRRRRGAYERRRREEEIYNQKRQEQAKQEQERRQEQQKQEQRQRQQPHKRPPRSPSRPQQARAPSQPPEPAEPTAPPAPSVSPAPPTPPETLPGPPTQPVQPVPSPERLEEAAKTIQTAYRIRRSLKALRDLEREFKYLKGHFSLPKQIDFQGPDGSLISVTPPDSLPVDAPLPDDVHIPIPKLAFNRTNYDLLSYIESLNRLLTRLDEVQSWGDPTVRQRRRRIVGKVEDEASRVEAYLKQAWLAHVAEQGKAEKGQMKE